MTNLPALTHLCSRYLHEDWAVHGDSPWEVVDKFAREEPEWAEGLPGEIDEVLNRWPTEEQLQHLIHDELGCNYLPSAHDPTYGGWLMAIADRIERPPADRRDQVDQRDQAMSNFPGVTELAGFFHQDFMDEYSGPWAAVDDFIDDRPELVAGLPEEVDRLLEQYPSEEQLAQFLHRAHFCYYVMADGWTYRTWLLAVADRMRRAKVN
jgi:hypothetical protein